MSCINARCRDGHAGRGAGLCDCAVDSQDGAAARMVRVHVIVGSTCKAKGLEEADGEERAPRVSLPTAYSRARPISFPEPKKIAYTTVMSKNWRAVASWNLGSKRRGLVHSAKCGIACLQHC